jgi:hypothetical protein
MKSRIVGCVLLTVFLLAGGSASATTWYVEPGGTGDALSIQGGIDLCAAGDTVLVACGIYLESGIAMTVPITLISETAEPGCVTVDAQSAETIVYGEWEEGNADVVGITFTGGQGDRCGGFDMTGSAVVNFDRCILVDNHGGSQPGGGRGGAVGCFDQSRASFRSCRLMGNSAYGGGGIFARNQTAVTLDTCILENNSAVWGGGVELRDDSSLEIVSCTLVGNESDSWQGGGVTNWSSTTVLVSNSIIAFGAYGSAVAGSFEFTACDLFGNAHGDWIGDIADQLGENGNLHADPLFCGEQSPPEPLTLYNTSPCAAENNPDYGLIGALPVGCISTAVVDGPLHAGDFALDHGFPNPFNPRATIAFDLAEPQLARLTVHTIGGEKVATLVDGVRAAGRHEVVWDGCDARGRAMPSGTYIVRLETARGVEATKVTLAR